MRLAAAVLLSAAAVASACAHGASAHARFGADAFNRAVSAASRGGVVFSPHSFEIDCAAFASAFGAIEKARYAERMGTLNGVEQVCGELEADLRSAVTNRFSVKCARALCLPDPRMANLAYRREVQSAFAMEVCSARPAFGVESWLRAAMDGAMEDFSLSDAAVEAGRYSFYDLVDVRFSWKDPFPTENTRRLPFRREDGSTVEMEAMCDLRVVEAWECRRFTLVRLPLADDAFFYAIVPAGESGVSDIRQEFSSTRIDDMLSSAGPVSCKAFFKGPAAIVVPKIDIVSNLDLTGVFSYFGLPIRGFSRMDGSLRPAAVVQRVRFRLDEQGLDDEPLARKPEGEVVRAGADARRFVLNRPFLFFAYHQPTGTIPIAGQFTGK